MSVADLTSSVMNPELRETIPNRPDFLDRLAARAEPFLTGTGVDLETARTVRLAFEEVGTNLLKYAYRDAREHEIRVTLRAEPSHIVLVVEDDGVAFDPRQAPKPDLDLPLATRPIGGLGLHLVRHLASGLEYRSSGGWNRLVLHFDRPPETRSPSIHKEMTSC